MKKPASHPKDQEVAAAPEKTASGNARLSRRRMLSRTAFFLLVVVALQAILFGPSLLGRKILVPLDILALPEIFLPRTPEVEKIVPHDFVLSDLVYQFEPARRFAASEIEAGRFPLWNPHQYAGSPFTWPKYSPFWIVQLLVESPIIIAWTQILVALVASLGIFLFSRRVLQVGFWPAVIAAWCYPLTGYFVFWQTYTLPMVIAWLPWLLWATDRTVRNPKGWGGPSLALCTCLVIIGGKLDVAGQVLLVSGLYAVWCFIDHYGKNAFKGTVPFSLTRKLGQSLPLRTVGFSVVVVTASWGLGFVLAGPELLPFLEYTRTGARMAMRGQGAEERPPVGIDALPQTVLPEMYGSTLDSGIPLFPVGQFNLLESSAATYTGLIATLFAAPLAWCSRRHRSLNVFWFIMGFLGLSWCLNVPGMVDLLRLPGLNMMSHNRFVFVTSFAILAMTAVGLDLLWQGEVKWRLWFWGPVAILAILLLWCMYRSAILPDDFFKLERAVRNGLQGPGIPALETIILGQASFARFYMMAAVLCILSLAGWALLGLRVKWRPWLVSGLATLLVADLLWFAYGRCSQCDPELYYPKIPALEQLAKAAPGRTLGFHCLPAILAQTQGLDDIRGYDGVDPARLIDLLKIASDPRVPSLPYAMTQWLVPRCTFRLPAEIQLHPIMDMLNVRYVIFRGNPWKGFNPEYSSPDYWVLTNRLALPRVFVPQRVEMVADGKERLSKMASKDFDPRQVAYVEQEIPWELPEQCRGTVDIVEEIPTRIVVSTNMRTPGLLVLADLWDPGWKAYCNGENVPILRTNHAIRGVEVREGKGTVEFRYESASLAWGWRLCGLALLIVLSRCFVIAWRSRRAKEIEPSQA
jgi:hypothetical protein